MYFTPVSHWMATTVTVVPSINVQDSVKCAPSDYMANHHILVYLVY